VITKNSSHLEQFNGNAPVNVTTMLNFSFTKNYILKILAIVTLYLLFINQLILDL